MSQVPKYLDQARDRDAFFFNITARKYEDYLDHEYSDNRSDHSAEWDEHYRNMRGGFVKTVLSLLEDKGMKQKDMNVGIIGPGLDPVSCELDNHVCDFHLSEFRSIVIIDFSQKIIRSAMDALIRAGVPSEKILGMQFDITNGLSTTYDRFLLEELQGIETEEELSRFTEKLENLDIGMLRQRLLDELDEAERGTVIPITETLIGGGENEDNTMALTVEGEPLPLHLVTYQMVLAGTGAAAEDRFWTAYREALSHTEYQSESNPDEEARREMLERIFHLITTFNTEVAVSTVRHVLRGNPDAMVTAATDISTIRKEPSHTFKRLDVDKLERRLANPDDNNDAPIQISIPRGGWTWADEPDHSHGVSELQFVLKKKSTPAVQTNTTEQPAKEPTIVIRNADETVTPTDAPKETAPSVDVEEVEQEVPAEETTDTPLADAPSAPGSSAEDVTPSSKLPEETPPSS